MREKSALLLTVAWLPACQSSVSVTQSPARVVEVVSPASSEPEPSVVQPAGHLSVAGLTWIAIGAGIEMTRSEVTVAQYRACVTAGACSQDKVHGIDWPGRVEFEPRRECTWPQGDDALPMNCVSYGDAVRFCGYAGGRLPTAPEWLKAASNEGTTRWPWGDDPEPDCKVAVLGLSEDGCAKTNPRPVCSRPDGNNRSGVCDLVGNVYEWTARPVRPSQPWVMVGECYNNFAASQSLEKMMLTVDDERYRTPPLGIRCVRDRT